MFGGFLGALAGGGQSFLSSFGSQHGQTAALNAFGAGTDWETPWGKGPYWNALTIPDLRKREFRAQVEAARENKVHPLFALGSSANFSPTVSSQPTGAQGGGGAGGFGPLAKLSAIQERKLAAEAENDEAQAMYWRARAAKEAQAPGGAPDASTDAGAGVKVYPLAPVGPPVHKRPLVSQPRQSIPERVELVDENGRRIMSLNPDAGLDEVGQAEYLRQKAIQAVSDALLDRRERVKRHSERKRRRVRRSEPDFWGGS